MNLTRLFSPALCLAALGAASGVVAQTITLRVEPDQSLLYGSEDNELILRIQCEPPTDWRGRRPQVNLALVLDRSGSMEGEKLRRAIEAASRALDFVGDDDFVSLVAYSDQAYTLSPPVRGRERERLRRMLSDITAQGSTALYDGVRQGAGEIEEVASRRTFNRVILLSDGLANVGPDRPSDLARLGRALAEDGISVTTIGLGLDYNEDLMARLAANAGGNTWFVRNPRDLASIFEEELSDITRVAVRDTKLEIVLPDDIEAIDIIGRDGTIEGRRVTVELGALSAGRPEFALLKVRVPQARGRSAAREVARVRATWEDAEGNSQQAEQNVSVAVTNDRTAASNSVNRELRQVAAANLVAEAEDRALDLHAEGKRAEATATMQAAGAAVSELAENEEDVITLAPFTLRAESSAGYMSQNSIDNAERKAMRAANHAVRNQQAGPTPEVAPEPPQAAPPPPKNRRGGPRVQLVPNQQTTPPATPKDNSRLYRQPRSRSPRPAYGW